MPPRIPRLSLATGLLAVLALAGCQQRPPADGSLRPTLDRLGLSMHAASTPTEMAAPTPAPLRDPILVPGSGRPGLAATTAAPTTTLSDNPEFDVAFEEADLPTVVKALLGDMLGQAYSVHPLVRGTVTVHGGRRLSARDVLGLLESVLRANGAALTRTASGYAIVPLAEARLAMNAEAAAGTPGFGISVLPLRFVSAPSMQKLLEPLYQSGVSIVADAGYNLLVVAGTGAERAAMVAAARSFDVDWMQGRSVGIFPLTQGAPGPVIRELQAIFDGPSGGMGSGLQLLPVDRVNGVLVVAADARRLEEVRGWIARLDIGQANARTIHVHPLQHAKASDVARILGRMLGSETRSDSAVTPPGQAEGKLAMQEPGANGQALDQTAQLVASGGGAAPVAGAGETRPTDALRTMADPRGNAIIVYANPEEDRMVEAAIRRLDVAPLQVLIEATIAEVTLNDALRYGVQSFFRSGDGQRFGGFTLNEKGPSPISQVPGFNLVFASGGGDPRAVLSALSEVTDVRVVSSPQVVVLDNQEALLKVGDRVPVITKQATDLSSANAALVNNVDFQDTGVILRVIPRIGQGGMVTMEVRQEVSNVSGTRNSGTLTPTISQRVLQSNVAVRSAQTVALGGLISDRQTEGRNGVPVLSSIPGLGALFSERSNKVERTELIVFITPRVIRDATEAEAVTGELVSRLRSLNPSPGS